MNNNEINSLIDNFNKLGLSPNEARVYLALTENHPITGYQLSKKSGIQRPVVYDMLTRLVEKGGAKVVRSNPDIYSPVEINEFLKNIEADITDAREQIADQIHTTLTSGQSDYFWNIITEKNILNALVTMIENSEHEILMEINQSRFLSSIIEPLEHTFQKNKNHIDIFSYYQLETDRLTLYSYNLPFQFTHNKILLDTIYITTDRQEAMIIQTDEKDKKSAKAIQSRNPSLVQAVHYRISQQIFQYRLWKLLGIERFQTMLTDEDRKFFNIIDNILKTNFWNDPDQD